MILFTADMDWASEEVLNFFFDSISKFEAKWIFFATNSNDRFFELARNGHHIGIHPNFIPCNTRLEMDKEVSRMKNIFPEASFSRSHSLMSGGPIWDCLQKNGITHDFSWFQPRDVMPQNRLLWNELIQIGYNWEDDYHFHIKNFEFNDHKKILKSGNLIVNFHPIHFYLNTSKKEDYFFYLDNKHNAKKIYEFRKRNWLKKTGCGIILLELLNNRTDAISRDVKEFVLGLPLEKYPWNN